MNKTDAYQLVTDRIIEALEAGVIPWRKPWGSASQGGRHVSIDGNRYKGVNPLLLDLAAQAAGYKVPLWMTFNAAKRHGGSVKKGERSTVVVFWKVLEKEERNEKTGKIEKKKIPVLRYFRVFNIAQTEGVLIPDRIFDELEANLAPREKGKIEAAEEILVGYLGTENGGPAVRETESASGCYYTPAGDAVTMVARERFESLEQFYSVAFHEAGHSTGHADRLARKGVTDLTAFGSHQYAREELVAEMTAAFLCFEAGIENEATQDQTTAYLQSWIRALTDDPKAVVIAAAQAAKAANWITGEARPGQSFQKAA